MEGQNPANPANPLNPAEIYRNQ